MKAGEQTFSLPPGTLGPAVTAAGTLVYPTAFYPAAASPRRRLGHDAIRRRARRHRPAGSPAARRARVRHADGPDGPAERPASGSCPAAAATTLIEPARVGGDDDGLDRRVHVSRGAGRTVRASRRARCRGRRSTVDEMGASVSVTPAGTDDDLARPRGGAAGSAADSAGRDARRAAAAGGRRPRRDRSDRSARARPARERTRRVRRHDRSPSTCSRSPDMRITLDPADGSQPGGLHARLADRPARRRPASSRPTACRPGRYVLRVSPLPAGWFLKGAIYQNRDIADTPLELGDERRLRRRHHVHRPAVEHLRHRARRQRPGSDGDRPRLSGGQRRLVVERRAVAPDAHRARREGRLLLTAGTARRRVLRRRGPGGPGRRVAGSGAAAGALPSRAHRFALSRASRRSRTSRRRRFGRRC